MTEYEAKYGISKEHIPPYVCQLPLKLAAIPMPPVKPPRSPGCSYCNEDVYGDGIQGTTEYIETSEWDFYHDGYVTIQREISYCPMCGRKLEEEKEYGN